MLMYPGSYLHHAIVPNNKVKQKYSRQMIYSISYINLNLPNNDIT